MHLYIHDSNFTLPYEFIKEENLDEMSGKDYIWELNGTNWIIDKIVTVVFKGNKFETQLVYVSEYKNPSNKEIFEGLTFINGVTPVGTKQKGLFVVTFEEF